VGASQFHNVARRTRGGWHAPYDDFTHVIAALRRCERRRHPRRPYDATVAHSRRRGSPPRASASWWSVRGRWWCSSTRRAEDVGCGGHVSKVLRRDQEQPARTAGDREGGQTSRTAVAGPLRLDIRQGIPVDDVEVLAEPRYGRRRRTGAEDVQVVLRRRATGSTATLATRTDPTSAAPRRPNKRRGPRSRAGGGGVAFPARRKWNSVADSDRASGLEWTVHRLP